MSALNKAIAERQFKHARCFFEQRMNLNSQSQNGETALIQLCYLEPKPSTAAMAKCLLRKGARIDVKDNKGLTAL